MLKYLLVGGATACLISCLSSESYEPSYQEPIAVKHYGAQEVSSPLELPVCALSTQSVIFYARLDSSYYFCDDLGYVAIDVPGLVGGDGGVDCITIPFDDDYALLCGERMVPLPRAPDSTSVESPATEPEPEPEIRCGEQVYDPADSTCIDGVLVANFMVGECSGVAYDRASSVCFQATVVAKAALRLCGTVYYDPLVSACLNSEIVPIESVEFCGNQIYDPLQNVCKNSQVVALGTCKGISYEVDTRMCDERDGQLYTYARLGGLDWMTQNLNFEINNGAGSWCFNNSPANCEVFGRLYDWATARGADRMYNTRVLGGGSANIQGVCPSGWYLPNNADWGALVANWAASKTTFGYVNAGEYKFGLTGYEWTNFNGNMILWSATEIDAQGATRYYVSPARELKRDDLVKVFGHTVRCVRTSAAMP